MSPLGFGKKEEKHAETAKALSDLEQICENDKEAYEALYHTMILNPKKVDTSLKDAIENAKRFEKEKNMTRARIWYDIAGGLAIYEGNAKKVVELFSEAEKLSGIKYPILKNAEKAVIKAQEYYKKHLKTETVEA
ncbi:hypothetical protein MUO74_04260 [Candidatus Bathyarchaeota archaeon]|nr:hypothetical protein [Candidatus Bathyarchaeota archaeon]